MHTQTWRPKPFHHFNELNKQILNNDTIELFRRRDTPDRGANSNDTIELFRRRDAPDRVANSNATIELFRRRDAPDRGAMTR